MHIKHFEMGAEARPTTTAMMESAISWASGSGPNERKLLGLRLTSEKYGVKKLSPKYITHGYEKPIRPPTKTDAMDARTGQ